MPPRKILLMHNRAPGDTLVLTGLVRDIALAHPGKFQIGVETSAMDLWRHNPHIVQFPKTGPKKARDKDLQYIKIEYGKGIREQNYEPIHFLHYFHRDFEKQTGTKVVPQLPYPDLHLSETERSTAPIEGRYWVLLSGGKSDFTAKVWEVAKMQQVVVELGKLGLGVVQIGSNDPGHWHPPLRGEHVVDLRARTSLRDMMQLIHHADGVICGVTCAMHMAAALQKPCVVLAGGREAWWWEAYVRENKGLGSVREKLQVPHRFLHTIGLLECCKERGCWKNKVVPLKNDRQICVSPVIKPNQPVPKCMDLIGVHHVMEAVMSYYTDKSLPPISLGVPSQAPAAPATPPTVPNRRLLDLFDDTPTPATSPPAAGQVQKHVQAVVTLPPGVKPEDVLKNAQVRVNPKAKLEGRGDKHTQPIATMPGGIAAQTNDAVFDHPDVGGKFTVCVLLYGPEQYHDLHHRCLSSILATVPRKRLDLRVGSNALNAKSLAMVERLVAEGTITKHYQHAENAWKYPVMREMFFDPACPITTKWVLWFDDDSICDRTPAWLNVLADTIIKHHRASNAHMIGAPFVWTLQNGQREWYEKRSWYRRKQWRLQNGKPSPSGNKILFCTGGFWAITHEAIVKCDIPDPDIGHNGGDITIGEQLYQGGFGMKAFNQNKQYVNTSSVPRRGDTKPMPGRQGHPQLRRIT